MLIDNSIRVYLRNLWRHSLLMLLVMTIASNCVVAAPTDSESSQQPRAVVDAATFQHTVRPFLDRHCVACHGVDEASGDLNLQELMVDFDSSQSASAWIEVMDRMNLGEMPPEGEAKPDVEQLRQVTSWIASELRAAEKRSHRAGGSVLLRRMNRVEYTNTIRDLLHLRFLPGESPLDALPPDGTAEGFDKLSSALMLDPSLLEKYFEVAKQIAERAIVDGPPEFPTEVMHYELEDTAENRAIRYLCAKPGFECRENEVMLMNGSTRSFGVMKYPGTKDFIPTKGMYRIRVRAWGTTGEDGQPVQMRVTQNHPREDQQLLIETTVTEQPQVYEVIVPRDPKSGEYHVSIVNGTGFTHASRPGLEIRKRQKKAGQAKNFEQVIRLQSRQQLEGLTQGAPKLEAIDYSRLPKLYVDWIECEGPLYEQWPPASHESLLLGESTALRDRPYLEKVFSRLMRRAFRRPVESQEVQRVVDLVESEIAAGESTQDAVRVGLVSVLCSPKFLYLVEPADQWAAPNTSVKASNGTEKATGMNRPAKRELNDWELASRLSYFLWSSMPDEELFELAEKGTLKQPEVLSRQIDRMLQDKHIKGFVDGFAAQWLKTGEFRNFTPDERLYREYDDELGEAMVLQALEFFREVLANDLPATEFIDSDWTMLNERLAEFYEIPDVNGEWFRRVSLPPESHRGGLLGMAGVAMRGSDGNRTKPVHRGVYVREVLFNDPPDPPPPNAGEVEPNIEGERLTVRQRLIQHQQIESCAACHRTIDGYGLAMENFNAIGAWRERQDGENFRGENRPPIDASGQLPNGQAFEDYEQFKALLVKQKNRFARGLAEKMLTYALGRPVAATDRGLVNGLVSQMRAEGYTLRSLIHGIVQSDAFHRK